MALFYRMNAQSRVLEQTLRLSQIGYQVIGGPRFYERAEVKDAMAYLQVIDNPADDISLLRVANRPRRGIGDTSLARLRQHAEVAGQTLFQTLAHPEDAQVAGAPLRAMQKLHTLLLSLQSAAQELEVPELLQAVVERSGFLESLEAERTIEARGRIENLEAFVDGAREYQLTADEPSLSGFLQEISLFSDQDALSDDARQRHAHDASQREGPRVPGGLHRRARGGDLPERALDRGAGDRGGAPAVLRRHDARDGAPDADARVRTARCGAGRRTTSRRASSTSCLPTTSIAGGCGRRRGRTTARRRRRRSSRARTCPSLHTGDSVRHTSLGEGVVTRIEPGGVVTVRFASDGSERRLMLDYAPLERV